MSYPQFPFPYPSPQPGASGAETSALKAAAVRSGSKPGEVGPKNPKLLPTISLLSMGESVQKQCL